VQCVVDHMLELTHDSSLFKEPNIRFGYYEGTSWVNEGGGVGETSVDAGGVTVELFTTFWGRLPSYMVSGWHAFLLEEEAQYFLPVVLPRGVPAAGYSKVLQTCTAIGKVFRWSILHKEPIPRQFASSVWFSYMLGADRISGEGCSEALLYTDEEVLLALLDHDPRAHKYLEPILKENAVGRSLSAVTHEYLSTAPELSTRIVQPDNHVELFRAAVHWSLIGQRREVLDSLRTGFGSEDTMAPLATTLLHHFADEERAAVISGNDQVTPEAVAALLCPVYPEAPIEGVSLEELQRNFNTLKHVVVSEPFLPHLRSFLRFVTSRESLLTNCDEKIQVDFDSEMAPDQLPVARTCFRQIVLPTRSVGSEAELLAKLVICARHSTSFGMK